MGALEGPHKGAVAPKGPQEAPKRPKMAKNEYTSKKIEKNEQNHEIRFIFLPIPQTSDRLTFFSIFDTI